MQVSQSVPSHSSRPASMPQATGARTPQPAPRALPQPLATEPAELDRVVDLGYN